MLGEFASDRALARTGKTNHRDDDRLFRLACHRENLSCESPCRRALALVREFPIGNLEKSSLITLEKKQLLRHDSPPFNFQITILRSR